MSELTANAIYQIEKEMENGGNPTPQGAKPDGSYYLTHPNATCGEGYKAWVNIGVNCPMRKRRWDWSTDPPTETFTGGCLEHVTSGTMGKEYLTITEAKIACNKNPECGGIFHRGDFGSRFYLRRKSDAETPSRRWSVYADWWWWCEREKVPDLSDYDAKTPKINSETTGGENYNPDCQADGYTSWKDNEGYDCPNNQWVGSCLVNNYPFSTEEEAIAKCDELNVGWEETACLYIMQDNRKADPQYISAPGKPFALYKVGHGQYYLRSKRGKKQGSMSNITINYDGHPHHKKGDSAPQKRVRKKCSAEEMIEPEPVHTITELCNARCSTCTADTDNIRACYICELCNNQNTAAAPAQSGCGPEYTEWTNGGKECNGMCLNGNYAYAKLSDAVTRCNSFTNCGGVMERNGKYYVRKNGGAPSTGRFCSKRVMAPPAKSIEELQAESVLPDMITGRNPFTGENDRQDDLTKTICGRGYGPWRLGGKFCDFNAVGNCINENQQYSSLADAVNDCTGMEECGGVMQFEDFKYYLRRANDGDYGGEHTSQFCAKEVPEVVDQATKPAEDCGDNYTSWVPFGKTCISDCLTESFDSLAAATTSCDSIEACEYVMKDSDGKYYLRKGNDTNNDNARQWVCQRLRHRGGSPSDPGSPPGPGSPPDSESTNIGVIVGIVLGVLFLVFVLLWPLLNKSNHNNHNNNHNNHNNNYV